MNSAQTDRYFLLRTAGWHCSALCGHGKTDMISIWQKEWSNRCTGGVAADGGTVDRERRGKSAENFILGAKYG
jgi:hypothetical protein